MTARSWLSFLRIHTSNLTQVGAMLGPLILGVRDIPTLFVFALWGLLYHAWGFTDNNIQDYEYDLKDPAKQHFALIKGDIPISTAKIVNVLLFFATIVGGVALCYPIALKPTAFAFFLLSVVSGMLYNRTCKKSLLAPAFIAIAFTSLPLFTYFTLAGSFSTPMILVGAYTIVLMLFQIAFEGYLKDIESDPVNLLRSWGAYVRNGTLHLGWQKYVWCAVKIINILLALGIILAVNSDVASEFVFCIFAVATSFAVIGLMRENYDNKNVVTYASRTEMLTYFTLVVALQGTLGWAVVAALIIYPIVWFITFNFATWKTLLRPKV